MSRLAVLAVLGLVVASGCLGARPDYDPGVTPEDFVAGIDNAYLPYVPGAWWRYEVDTDEGREVIEVRVQPGTRDVNGVAATVVRDTVTVDGQLVEDTYDWYAQDRDGTVWYLGEDTTEYEDGEPASHAGAWAWGVDGALPGIIMHADWVPDNEPYFQEFYWGEAVDEAANVDEGRTVTVPVGTFSDTRTTREWTRLERGVEEMVHYARGVGVVWKGVVDGDEAEVLVAYHVPLDA